MSRNRKNQSAAIRFVPALKAALLCLFIGGSAIGYVWQKNQLTDLGRKILEKETRLKQLRQANVTLSKQLDTLRAPACLERRLKELGIPLVQPSQAQIMRLVEMPPGELPPVTGPLLADHGAGQIPALK